MSAWVKQKASQVAKHGAKAASWYCIWDEPDGTRRMQSCGAGRKGKRNAEKKADLINTQLTLGTYGSNLQNRTTWPEFVTRYRSAVLSRLESSSAVESVRALD